MPYQLMLKELRNSHGISQEDMADKLDMKLSTYRTWERSISRISLEKAYDICEILDCTPNDLCGWYIDHPSDRPRPAPADPYEAELVESYRGMDRIARMTVVETVRGQAALSASRGERGAAAPEVRAAGE